MNFSEQWAMTGPLKKVPRTLSIAALSLPVDMEVQKFKERAQLRCRPCHLTMIQNYEARCQKPMSCLRVRRKLKIKSGEMPHV
ncbi:hypothetical protein TNCV_2078731 [Trichonephila clavipes]|nr:hypothetical protein TNCV_2078731 [Trichonephila clavipes]